MNVSALPFVAPSFAMKKSSEFFSLVNTHLGAFPPTDGMSASYPASVLINPHRLLLDAILLKRVGGAVGTTGRSCFELGDRSGGLVGMRGRSSEK